MLVYAACANCQENSTIPTAASTPQDLAREKGERFIAKCSACGRSFDAEAMRTRARVNPTKLLLGFAASVLLFTLIWSFGFLAVVAVAPAVIVWRLEESAVTNYNRLSAKKWG